MNEKSSSILFQSTLSKTLSIISVLDSLMAFDTLYFFFRERSMTSLKEEICGMTIFKKATASIMVATSRWVLPTQATCSASWPLDEDVMHH